MNMRYQIIQADYYGIELWAVDLTYTSIAANNNLQFAFSSFVSANEVL